VERCNNILLIITEGSVFNTAIQQTISAAKRTHKHFVLVLSYSIYKLIFAKVHDERNCKFPAVNELGQDIKSALYIKAVPWIESEGFVQVSIDMVAEKLV
jgi:hypothetical protein